MAEVPISGAVELQTEKGPLKFVPVLQATAEEQWTIDPENARNWSASRKAFVTVVVSLIGFVW